MLPFPPYSIIMGGRPEYVSNTKSDSKNSTNSMHDGRSSRNISKNSNLNGRRGEPTKRRKGTRGSNSNNIASAPPARELVEATARFLSQFYDDQRRRQESSARIEAEDVIRKGGVKDASRLRQRAHHDTDHDHKSDVYKNTEEFKLHLQSGELESQRSQDGCRTLAGHRNGTCGVDTRIRETATKARRDKEVEEDDDGGGEDILDEFLCLRIFGHRSSSQCQDSDSMKKRDAASAGCSTTRCEQSGGGGGRVKGKSKKGKRGKSNSKRLSIALGGAGNEAKGEVRLEELREGDDREVDSSGCRAFLENFRSAKRHYKVKLSAPISPVFAVGCFLFQPFRSESSILVLCRTARTKNL